eukprot:jgi/Mesvir1/18832/Mv11433-RA.1
MEDHPLLHSDSHHGSHGSGTAGGGGGGLLASVAALFGGSESGNGAAHVSGSSSSGHNHDGRASERGASMNKAASVSMPSSPHGPVRQQQARFRAGLGGRPLRPHVPEPPVSPRRVQLWVVESVGRIGMARASPGQRGPVSGSKHAGAHKPSSASSASRPMDMLSQLYAGCDGSSTDGSEHRLGMIQSGSGGHDGPRGPVVGVADDSSSENRDGGVMQRLSIALGDTYASSLASFSHAQGPLGDAGGRSPTSVDAGGARDGEGEGVGRQGMGGEVVGGENGPRHGYAESGNGVAVGHEDGPPHGGDGEGHKGDGRQRSPRPVKKPRGRRVRHSADEVRGHHHLVDDGPGDCGVHGTHDFSYRRAVTVRRDPQGRATIATAFGVPVLPSADSRPVAWSGPGMSDMAMDASGYDGAVLASAHGDGSHVGVGHDRADEVGENGGIGPREDNAEVGWLVSPKSHSFPSLWDPQSLTSLDVAYGGDYGPEYHDTHGYGEEDGNADMLAMGHEPPALPRSTESPPRFAPWATRLMREPSLNPMMVVAVADAVADHNNRIMISDAGHYLLLDEQEPLALEEYEEGRGGVDRRGVRASSDRSSAGDSSFSMVGSRDERMYDSLEREDAEGAAWGGRDVDAEGLLPSIGDERNSSHSHGAGLDYTLSPWNGDQCVDGHPGPPWLSRAKRHGEVVKGALLFPSGSPLSSAGPPPFGGSMQVLSSAHGMHHAHGPEALQGRQEHQGACQHSRQSSLEWDADVESLAEGGARGACYAHASRLHQSASAGHDLATAHERPHHRRQLSATSSLGGSCLEGAPHGTGELACHASPSPFHDAGHCHHHHLPHAHEWAPGPGSTSSLETDPPLPPHMPVGWQPTHPHHHHYYTMGSPGGSTGMTDGAGVRVGVEGGAGQHPSGVWQQRKWAAVHHWLMSLAVDPSQPAPAPGVPIDQVAHAHPPSMANGMHPAHASAPHVDTLTASAHSSGAAGHPADHAVDHGGAVIAAATDALLTVPNAGFARSSPLAVTHGPALARGDVQPAALGTHTGMPVGSPFANAGMATKAGHSDHGHSDHVDRGRDEGHLGSASGVPNYKARSASFTAHGCVTNAGGKHPKPALLMDVERFIYRGLQQVAQHSHVTDGSKGAGVPAATAAAVAATAASAATAAAIPASAPATAAAAAAAAIAATTATAATAPTAATATIPAATVAAAAAAIAATAAAAATGAAASSSVGVDAASGLTAASAIVPGTGGVVDFASGGSSHVADATKSAGLALAVAAAAAAATAVTHDGREPSGSKGHDGDVGAGDTCSTAGGRPLSAIPRGSSPSQGMHGLIANSGAATLAPPRSLSEARDRALVYRRALQVLAGSLQTYGPVLGQILQAYDDLWAWQSRAMSTNDSHHDTSTPHNNVAFLERLSSVAAGAGAKSAPHVRQPATTVAVPVPSGVHAGTPPLHASPIPARAMVGASDAMLRPAALGAQHGAPDPQGHRHHHHHQDGSLPPHPSRHHPAHHHPAHHHPHPHESHPHPLCPSPPDAVPAPPPTPGSEAGAQKREPLTPPEGHGSRAAGGEGTGAEVAGAGDAGMLSTMTLPSPQAPAATPPDGNVDDASLQDQVASPTGVMNTGAEEEWHDARSSDDDTHEGEADTAGEDGEGAGGGVAVRGGGGEGHCVPVHVPTDGTGELPKGPAETDGYKTLVKPPSNGHTEGEGCAGTSSSDDLMSSMMGKALAQAEADPRPGTLSAGDIAALVALRVANGAHLHPHTVSGDPVAAASHAHRDAGTVDTSTRPHDGSRVRQHRASADSAVPSGRSHPQGQPGTPVVAAAAALHSQAVTGVGSSARAGNHGPHQSQAHPHAQRLNGAHDVTAEAHRPHTGHGSSGQEVAIAPAPLHASKMMESPAEVATVLSVMAVTAAAVAVAKAGVCQVAAQQAHSSMAAGEAPLQGHASGMPVVACQLDAVNSASNACHADKRAVGHLGAASLGEQHSHAVDEPQPPACHIPFEGQGHTPSPLAPGEAVEAAASMAEGAVQPHIAVGSHAATNGHLDTFPAVVTAVAAAMMTTVDGEGGNGGKPCVLASAASTVSRCTSGGTTGGGIIDASWERVEQNEESVQAVKVS